MMALCPIWVILYLKNWYFNLIYLLYKNVEIYALKIRKYINRYRLQNDPNKTQTPLLMTWNTKKKYNDQKGTNEKAQWYSTLRNQNL